MKIRGSINFNACDRKHIRTHAHELSGHRGIAQERKQFQEEHVLVSTTAY